MPKNISIIEYILKVNFVIKHIALVLFSTFLIAQMAFAQRDLQTEMLAYKSGTQLVQVQHDFAFLAAIPAIIAGVAAAAKAAAAAASAAVGAVVGAVKAAATALAVKVPIIAKAATVVAKVAPTLKKIATVTKKVVNIAQKVHKVVDKVQERIKANPQAVAAIRAMRSGVTFAAAIQLTQADAQAVKDLQEDEKELKTDVHELRDAGEKEQAQEEYGLYLAAVKCSGYDPIKKEQVKEKPGDEDCQDFGQNAAEAALIFRRPLVRFSVDENKADLLKEETLDTLEADISNIERDGTATANAEEKLADDFIKYANDAEAGADKETLAADLERIRQDTDSAADADAAEFADWKKAMKDGGEDFGDESGAEDSAMEL